MHRLDALGANVQQPLLEVNLSGLGRRAHLI